MLKRLLMIVVGLFGLASLSYAQVEIVDSGKKELDRNLDGNKITKIHRTISVKNQCPVNYGFRYRYFLNPSIGGEKLTEFLAKNVRFPYIGDTTAGTTGLGLMGAAWYRNGFLGIEINKKLLNRTVAKEIKVEEGERGIVDFIWEPEWAEIKARFVFLPKDNKVYTEITLAPKVEVNSLGVRLLCVPGYWKGSKDRWLATAKRSIQQSKEPALLNPKEEPWIYYFDTKAADIYGTCAVMYLPEEVIEAKVKLADSCRTSLTFSPEVRKIHLIFWNFPGSYKKQEEAYNYLKENGEELLENLRKFNFKINTL